MIAIVAGLDTGVVAPLLYFLSAIGNLGLAILVVSRGRDARGSFPLTLLCLALFAWQMGEGLRAATAASHWKYLRLVASSVAPAFLFHFVMHFVRREREFAKITSLLYGITALFALLTAGALFIGVIRALVDHWIWNIVYIVFLFPFLLLAFFLLLRRQREAESRVERNATNFIALGIVVGAFSGFVDLTVALGNPFPPLGHIGGLASTLILAVAILRHRLLDMDIPFQRILLILAVAASAVIVVVAFSTRVGGERGDLLLAVTAFVIVAVLAVYRLALRAWYERREQQRRLALLGTMAAGVAHEIRNPLAAIKGAAQFVQKDLEAKRYEGESVEYMKLVIEETDRLNQVVESFLDLTRPLSPDRRPVELSKLVDEVVTLQRAAGGPAIDFERESRPTISADPDLVKVAVGNILRNAVEAAARRVVVRVRALRNHAEIEIEDDGSGIPAERMDQLFQPFFTTKARGTGLGLVTARRIVESHGGEIGARNVQPRGARFTMLFPSGGVDVSVGPQVS